MSAKAAAAVAATLTPSSITQVAASTLQITGLTAGATAQVERWVDSNGNGAVDAGEPLVDFIRVTDGQWPSIGGVRDTNQAGDEDSLANSQISVTLSPGTGLEGGRVAGSQLVRVSSPTAAFTPILRTLAVTQVAQAQTISGNVTNGASAVPFASVIALAGGPGSDGEMMGGAVANAAGAYTLSLPAGAYKLAVFKAGVVGGFGTSGVVTLGTGSSVTKHLTVVTAARTITGKVSDLATGAGLGGVQIFVATQTDLATIVSTGVDGTYTAQVTADAWSLEFSSQSFARLGYLGPASNGPDGFELLVSTVASSVTGQNVTLEKATALLYGEVKNPGNMPVPGLWMGASDTTGRENEAVTDANGRYVMGVLAGNWNLWVDDWSPALVGYVAPPGTNHIVTAGQATQQNFTLIAVNAHLTGTVTKNGSPVEGIRIGAYNNNTDVYISKETAADGSFDLGLVAGTWSLQLEENSAADFSVVGSSTDYTLAVNQTISGISFAVRETTATISGTVRDDSNQGVSQANVYAYATISGTTYVSGSQTDGTGQYSMPVVNGSWQVGVNANGFPNPAEVTVVVSGANVVRDLTLSRKPSISQDPTDETVEEGQTFVFSINTSNGGDTYRWQVSTNGGSTWSNLSDNANYSGTSTHLLDVEALLSMNGYRYRCVVTNSYGSTNSGSALLTVTPGGTPPPVPTGPVDQVATDGQTFVFSINTSGVSDTYRWQVSTNGGTSWSNLSNNSNYSGTSTHLLGVTASVSLNGYRYRCVVTNNYGSTNSGSALLTVSPAPSAPNIVDEPVAASTTPGVSATFQVTASGYPAPSFQWQLSTDNGFNWSNLSNSSTHSGATGPMLAVMNPTLAQNGHRYRVIATNASGSDASLHAVLTVALSGFTLWQQGNFTAGQLANSAISGPLATPAGDGVSNLYKYAFDRTPFAPGYGNTLTAPFLIGGNLILIFPATKSDVTYTVKASTDLINWTTTGVNTQVNGTQRTASYAAGSSQVFLRIYVTQP